MLSTANTYTWTRAERAAQGLSPDAIHDPQRADGAHTWIGVGHYVRVGLGSKWVKH